MYSSRWLRHDVDTSLVKHLCATALKNKLVAPAGPLPEGMQLWCLFMCIHFIGTVPYPTHLQYVPLVQYKGYSNPMRFILSPEQRITQNIHFQSPPLPRALVMYTCPHQNHYIPSHINNRYINSYKSIAMYVLTMGYPMIPLSGQSNLADRSL